MFSDHSIESEKKTFFFVYPGNKNPINFLIRLKLNLYTKIYRNDRNDEQIEQKEEEKEDGQRW